MRWLDVPQWVANSGIAANKPVGIGAILGVSLLLTIMIKRVSSRVEAKVARHTTPLRALQRAHTLATVVASTGIVAVWVLAVIVLLSSLGLDVRGLFAGVGLAGLAIGLGAQDLIKDILAGFFTILEDRYGVGDIVRVNGKAAGRVEQLTLRVTGLRDLDGTLSYINNGEIKEVANLSKEWSGALVDIPVAHTEDPARVRNVLERVTEATTVDPEIRRKLNGKPKVLGIETLDSVAATWRLLADTKPGRQWDVARRLREMVKEAFLEEGIRAPHQIPTSVRDETGETVQAIE
jgi:small-conductance mechanosensitive channel